MVMAYVIKHDPSGLFVHIAFGSYDALNLGVNPKIYNTLALAEHDLAKVPEILEVDIKRAQWGLWRFENTYLKPLVEKNAVRKHPTRTKNIQFYESKIASIRKELDRFENVKTGRFYIDNA
jgi:hypothetical protein